MIETKLDALQKQGRLTEAQADELRRNLWQDEAAYPALGERVRLTDDPAEALTILKGKRHVLLEISRDPADPERFLFVLRLRADAAAPGKRLGQPRTWMLVGIAIGASLASVVQILWPKPKPKAPEAPAPTMIMYPAIPAPQPVTLQPSSSSSAPTTP